MKYSFKVPSSKTEQTVEFTLPDLPPSVMPIITGTTPIDVPPPPVDPPPGPVTPSSVEGFGSAVKGGEGLQVVMCNSLTQAALQAAIGTGNRIVKFGVSGTIRARLEFSNLKNITIDGEGKILIDNNNNGDAFAFEGLGCDNIIVKNLRVRNCGNDAIGIRCKNVVITHCSFDKSGDGLVDMTDNAENISVEYCIFGNCVSGAMLLAYAGRKNISVHHNVFFSWERMPLVHRANNNVPTNTEDLMCEFVNNVVWGPWSNAGVWVAYGGTCQAKNNYFSKAGNAIRIEHPASSKVFASGNIAKGGASVDNKNHAEWIIPAANRITMLPALDAAKKVLAEAGARPLDKTDQDFINSIIL